MLFTDELSNCEDNLILVSEFVFPFQRNKQTMGAFATKHFLRNDGIDGQGKEVLIFCKRIHLANNELDRIFHEFKKFEDPESFKLDTKAMFSRYKIPCRVFERILFQIYDHEKSGHLSFLEYLVIVWGFLTCDDENLAHLCFSLFDVDR